MADLNWIEILATGALPIAAIFVQGRVLRGQKAKDDEIERKKIIWSYDLEKLKRLEGIFSTLINYAGHFSDISLLPIRYTKEVEAAISEVRVIQLGFPDYKLINDDLFVFVERYTLVTHSDKPEEEKERLFHELIKVGGEIVSNCRKTLLGETTESLSISAIDRTNRKVTVSVVVDEQTP